MGREEETRPGEDGVRAKIVTSTGQSWWAGPWEIYDAEWDYYDVPFEMGRLGLSSPREVTFTVQLYTSDNLYTGSSVTITEKVDSVVPTPYIYNTYISNGVDSDNDGYYEGFDIR